MLRRWFPLIAGVFAVLVGGSILFNTEPKEKDPEIVEMYSKAEVMIENGSFIEAIDIYSQIITAYPSEETAWHEKGKILNRLKMCSESLGHYAEYVELFPDSTRGMEGYGIAKKCLL
ncbi:MAG: hypothetical protein HKM23_04580 [Nitrosopumilus sp.]|nr:hypothetical protein [Nitrosopumilus sp.]NNL59017.1 hypothetical protein [Nitrosopumilus sp.]